MRKLLILAALLPALCNAEQLPKPGKFDPRVRMVAYNPQDIVTLTTYYNVPTMIRFGEGEKVTKDSLEAGLREAWKLSASESGNVLYVQPRAPEPETFMTVVTNKRVYIFRLTVLGVSAPVEKSAPIPVKGKGKGKGKADKKAPAAEPVAVASTETGIRYDRNLARSKDLTISVTFTYPEDGARNEGPRPGDLLREHAASARERATNMDYYAAGDDAVIPVEARDDGRFIYLTFGRTQAIPTVESLDENGKPSALNPTMDGDTMIIDRLVRHLRLRLGEDGPVACIVNRSFDRNRGADNSTGTVSPNVIRVLKGAAK